MTDDDLTAGWISVTDLHLSVYAFVTYTHSGRLRF